MPTVSNGKFNKSNWCQMSNDIAEDLVKLSSLYPEYREVLQEAVKEIIELRTALIPFANWSNRISHNDIVKAKKLLDKVR